jgi:ketosteroid isomerase-like protein
MKTIIVTLSLICLISACSEKTVEITEGTEVLPSSNLPAENKKLIQEYFTHFNKHDWKSMASLYADTAELKDPVYGTKPIKQTQAQIIEKYMELGTMIPNVRDSIVAQYPSGNMHYIVEFISKGKTPDGNSFELPICTIFTIKNGKITGDYTYYDNFESTK